MSDRKSLDPDAAMEAAPKQTLYYIPHTHWEGAVFFTREEFLESGLSNLLSAMRLLEKYPEYTFALDQVAYIKPFLERYPEHAAAFRKYIKQGRLDIVGGMDIMPDVVKQGGELFVRQMQYGKQYCREVLGLEVTAAWQLDTFGHHPQIPQLLKLAGFKSFWFCRGVPTRDMPSEFNWLGLDGSTIPAFWLPGFYGLFYGPPRDQAGFDRFFTDQFRSLDAHTEYPERVGLAGVDVSEPEDYVTPLVEHFNEEVDRPFNIRYSVPTEFAEVVARRSDTPTISGDFNPIFQGTFSSRSALKQATHEIERKLLDAEKLGSIANWLGYSTDNEMLWRAWEPLLFSQAHDLSSGVMADHVYEDTVFGNEFSRRLADELLNDRWDQIAAHIDTSGPGTSIVVFNSLGSPRTDVVQADLGWIEPNVYSLAVIGPDSEVIPCQIDSAEKYNDGSFRRTKISFLSQDIPALGYKTYHVVATPITDQTATSSALPAKPDENVIENEFYKVTVNLKTGAIESIVDKSTGMETLSSPGNVVSRQVDNGDLWELYHTLDGASHVAMTNQQPVPNLSNALLTTLFGDKPGSIIRGPTYSEFAVSHPFGNGSFATRIRISNGVRRIDIETTIVNHEKQVRFQVLFPTTVSGGRYTQEIPYGAVDRPTSIENPALNWVDYSDGKTGIALLNFGTPGNLVSDGTLILSLFRSQCLGDYNLGNTSESGFELGIPHTFRYSIVPHSGNWRDAEIYKEGQAFTNPLLIRKSEPHPGKLASCWGFVEISHANVVLSSLKPGADGTTIIRVYEASGHAAPEVRIKIRGQIESAQEANLLEDPGDKLKVEGNEVVFDLGPFEIKTIKLHVGSE